jgi:hypothetical protein
MHGAWPGMQKYVWPVPLALKVTEQQAYYLLLGHVDWCKNRWPLIRPIVCAGGGGRGGVYIETPALLSFFIRTHEPIIK